MQRASASNGVRNLRMVGEGRAGSGNYRRVSILGNSLIEGNLSCKNLKVTGDFQVAGQLSCVDSGLRVLGNLSVQADTNVKNARVLGVWRIDGQVQAERIRITGELVGGGSVSAELFQVYGAVSINGLINAEKVKIRMHGPSRVAELVGAKMSIRPSRWPWGSRQSNLSVDLVEGDDLELSSITAEVVRGKRITLGPGCQIKHLEYQEEYIPHPKSKVSHVHHG